MCNCSTDEAAALTGIVKQITVIEIAPQRKFTHYINHGQATAKNLEPETQQVGKDVISMVNVMKTRLLNSNIFTIPCNKMRRDHKNMLYREGFTAYKHC